MANSCANKPTSLRVQCQTCTSALETKTCNPLQAHAYYKRHLTFVDELKLVEEEIIHNDKAIETTGGNCERLLRRRQHLEFERERHETQKTRRQRRVESRRQHQTLQTRHEHFDTVMLELHDQSSDRNSRQLETISSVRIHA
jgi:type VI protein secretion system component VasA